MAVPKKSFCLPGLPLGTVFLAWPAWFRPGWPWLAREDSANGEGQLEGFEAAFSEALIVRVPDTSAPVLLSVRRGYSGNHSVRVWSVVSGFTNFLLF